MLKELLPSATRVAVVWNPDNALWPRMLAALDDTAKTLGVTIQRLEVRRAEDLHGAFLRAVADRANALLFVKESLFTANRAEISNHAIRVACRRFTDTATLSPPVDSSRMTPTLMR